MKIEVLGMGCRKCQETERRVQKAASDLNLEAEIVHIKDPNQIAEYGVWSTPGLVIDGEVKISGKVPSVDDLKQMLQGT